LSLLVAISGKQPGQQTVDLLRGVVQLERYGDAFVLARYDNSLITYDPATTSGAYWLSHWRTVEDTATREFGASAGKFIKSISSVTMNGNFVHVDRTSSDRVLLDLRSISPPRGPMPVRITGARLGDISFVVDTSGQHPVLRRITGVQVAVTSARIPFSLDLREFSRWTASDGRHLLRVVVKNPLPAPVRTVCRFFGMPENLPFTFALPTTLTNFKH
jgi:hypothetical protein